MHFARIGTPPESEPLCSPLRSPLSVKAKKDKPGMARCPSEKMAHKTPVVLNEGETKSFWQYIEYVTEKPMAFCPLQWLLPPYLSPTIAGYESESDIRHDKDLSVLLVPLLDRLGAMD